MIRILIAIIIAALAFWLCLALGLPTFVAALAAVLIIIVGFIGRGYY